MAMYICFIIAELAMAVAVKLLITNKIKQEKMIAQIGMIMLFFLLALKKYTVGIDIAGYKEQYEIAAIMPWNNFNYVYFEKGYLLLTKLFSKAGISFQIFMICAYAALSHATYLLIRKFSPNVTLSILIFIGYNFLVFSLSGVRQTIAIALCIYAFLACVQYTRKGLVAAVLLNIAAVSIHESAIVFFAVLAIVVFMNRKILLSAWVLLTAAVFVLRSPIWKLVSYLYGMDITVLSVSETFVFLAGMLLFGGFTYFYYKKKRIVRETDGGIQFYYDAFLVRAVCLCLMCQILFTGGTMLRANMYFTVFLLPGIPVWTSKYPYKTRAILNAAMGMLMLALFADSLSINQLEMCPYLFFWQ